MKKIEQVFREVLFQAMENRNKRMTQLGLSENLGFSLSTINLALKKLEKMNAVRIGKMNFSVIDIKKILYFWASIRNLEKDIACKIKINMPVRDIERNMHEVFLGAFI